MLDFNLRHFFPVFTTFLPSYAGHIRMKTNDGSKHVVCNLNYIKIIANSISNYCCKYKPFARTFVNIDPLLEMQIKGGCQYLLQHWNEKYAVFWQLSES